MSEEKLIEKGDEIFCPNMNCQTLIGTIKRDLFSGDRLDESYFEFYPFKYKNGDFMDCRVCGEPWGKTVLFIKNKGWC